MVMKVEDKAGNSLKVGDVIVSDHGRGRGSKDTITSIDDVCYPRSGYLLRLKSGRPGWYSRTVLREDAYNKTYAKTDADIRYGRSDDLDYKERQREARKNKAKEASGKQIS